MPEIDCRDPLWFMTKKRGHDFPWETVALQNGAGSAAHVVATRFQIPREDPWLE